MSTTNIGNAFIKRISEQALSSAAINHPYLTAISKGEFGDMQAAFQDFAYQYGLYSKHFTRYLTAVIDNLSEPNHKNILLENLQEEQGNAHDVDLPPEVLLSVLGQPHCVLFKRFQQALSVDEHYALQHGPCQTGLFWSKHFLHLCQENQYIGLGAIGIGTELIVSRIYEQILMGLEHHSGLSQSERVFFDLHSGCDDEHAAQILAITEELASSQSICEQIEYGTKMALNMRIMFWDKMLERALHFGSRTSGNDKYAKDQFNNHQIKNEKLTAIGY